MTTHRSLTLLITAGPTREPIDPVRFLSNYSTGVLGHRLVIEARKRGHRVLFVTGPTGLAAPRGAKTIAVETALQMQEALAREFPAVDAVIMAAAVADFRPIRALPRHDGGRGDRPRGRRSAAVPPAGQAGPRPPRARYRRAPRRPARQDIIGGVAKW